MLSQPLELLKTKDEWIKLSLILSIIFLLNLSYLFYQYKNFKTEEIYSVKGYVQNIYPKERYDILKISTKEFDFFTSIDKTLNIKKLQYIEANIISTQVDFISYLKGFYTKTININIDPNIKHKKSDFFKSIQTQHTQNDLAELYSALFLAIPVNPQLRDVFAQYGVSHLVAISGFHLGVLSFLIFWIVYVVYKPLQEMFFPYRNRKYDILVICILGLSIYLYYIEFVASFLRAFVMFIIGIYLLRHNIKLFSFSTLLLTLLFIVAFFPKLLFSLSLWFSIAGVFYIFLFIKYFKNLNKIVAFFFFNIWIFLALNPIIHYFFGVSSYEQMLSPIFTILFSIFYPLSLFLHLINYGDVFDNLLKIWIDKNIHSVDIFTSLYLFVFYIIISLLSIFSKKAFIILNITWCAFYIYTIAKL